MVDLKRDAEQALWVERIAKRRSESDEPFALLNGHNRFVDARQGMHAQTGAQRAILDAAVNSFGTYLELWHLYGQKEWDKDVQRASELKALRYSACQPASEEGGGWRLSVQREELKVFSQRWRVFIRLCSKVKPIIGSWVVYYSGCIGFKYGSSFVCRHCG